MVKYLNLNFCDIDENERYIGEPIKNWKVDNSSYSYSSDGGSGVCVIEFLGGVKDAKLGKSIKNNVLELIDFDPKGKYPNEIEIEFIKCPEYVESGYLHINNEWYESNCYELDSNENNEITKIEAELIEIKNMIKENQLKL